MDSTVNRRDVMSDAQFKKLSMLVSDSNEVSKQFDSKKLTYSELANLFQDRLFKNHLDMSRYLTLNQFEMHQLKLNNEFLIAKAECEKIDSSVKPRLRPVVGQIILIECSCVGPGQNPMDIVEERWDITQDLALEQISGCMLRGASAMADADTHRLGNEEVQITRENVPSHMHHSSITSGSGLKTMSRTSGTEKAPSSGTQYDMFYNDSMDVGLSKNELDGVVDTFSVDSSGDGDTTIHDNMPLYNGFYAFEVKKA